MLWITGILVTGCKEAEAGTLICDVLGDDPVWVMPYKDGDWGLMFEVPRSAIGEADRDMCWINTKAACLDLSEELNLAVENGEVELHPSDPSLCRRIVL